MFEKDEVVWCRPNLSDAPICGKYVEKMSDEQIRKGYRAGHIVEVNGLECWVRLDLCSINKESIKDIRY